MTWALYELGAIIQQILVTAGFTVVSVSAMNTVVNNIKSNSTVKSDVTYYNTLRNIKRTDYIALPVENGTVRIYEVFVAHVLEAARAKGYLNTSWETGVGRKTQNTSVVVQYLPSFINTQLEMPIKAATVDVGDYGGFSHSSVRVLEAEAPVYVIYYRVTGGQYSQPDTVYYYLLSTKPFKAWHYTNGKADPIPEDEGFDPDWMSKSTNLEYNYGGHSFKYSKYENVGSVGTIHSTNKTHHISNNVFTENDWSIESAPANSFAVAFLFGNYAKGNANLKLITDGTVRAETWSEAITSVKTPWLTQNVNGWTEYLSREKTTEIGTTSSSVVVETLPLGISDTYTENLAVTATATGVGTLEGTGTGALATELTGTVALSNSLQATAQAGTSASDIVTLGTTTYNSVVNGTGVPQNASIFTNIFYFPTWQEANFSLLAQINDYLWSNTWAGAFNNLYSNPADTIVSLMAFPIGNSSGDERKQIYFGNCPTGIYAYRLKNQFEVLDLGELEPSSYDVYGKSYNNIPLNGRIDAKISLPYIGDVEIDSSLLFNFKWNVQYRVDWITGSCTAVIYIISKATGTTYFYSQHSGSMAMPVPFGGQSFGNTLKTALTGTATAIGFAAGGAAGAMIGGLAGNTFSTGMTEQGVKAKSNISGFGGFLGEKKCRMLVTWHQRDSSAPDYYDKFIEVNGAPAGGDVYRVGDITGFSKCIVHSSGFSATEWEHRRIEEILKEGYHNDE